MRQRCVQTTVLFPKKIVFFLQQIVSTLQETVVFLCRVRCRVQGGRGRVLYPRLGFQVSNPGIRVSGFAIQDSILGFQGSDFRCRVSVVDRHRQQSRRRRVPRAHPARPRVAPRPETSNSNNFKARLSTF